MPRVEEACCRGSLQRRQTGHRGRLKKAKPRLMDVQVRACTRRVNSAGMLLGHLLGSFKQARWLRNRIFRGRTAGDKWTEAQSDQPGFLGLSFSALISQCCLSLSFSSEPAFLLGARASPAGPPRDLPVLSECFLLPPPSPAADGTPSRRRRGLLQLAGAIQCTTGRTPFAYLRYGCFCGLGGAGWPSDEADW